MREEAFPLVSLVSVVPLFGTSSQVSYLAGRTLATSTCVLPLLLHCEEAAGRSFRGASLDSKSCVGSIHFVFPPVFLRVRG